MRRSVAIKKMHYIQFTIVKWTFDPYTCVIFQCSEWFYILFSHFLIPHIYKEHYRSKKTTTKNFAQKVLPPMCETTVECSSSLIKASKQQMTPTITIAGRQLGNLCHLLPGWLFRRLWSLVVRERSEVTTFLFRFCSWSNKQMVLWLAGTNPP